jgi:hypothetical protein
MTEKIDKNVVPKGTVKSEQLVEKKQNKLRKDLRNLGNRLLQVMKEEVDSAIFLGDFGRLERLTSAIHIHMDSEVIRGLREKGFEKKIRKLCDQAGRVP